MPIEKNYGHNDPFGGGYGNGFGSRNRLGFVDGGPPYIVKLTNIPVSSDESFVEDLFRSRFTTFAKFKIVLDPLSRPLETGAVKKIAFVELNSFADQNRVLKWQDLYYRGSRRVVIEMADFADFKNCIAFNQENEQALQQVQLDFAAGKNRPEPVRRVLHNDHMNSGGNTPHQNILILPPLRAPEPKPEPVPAKPKSNPFGNAKPVDVLARLHEIDKKLITVKHAVVTTPGLLLDDGPVKKEKKENGKAEEKKKDIKPVDAKKDETAAPGFPGLTPAPIPSSVYGQKQSLADLLGSKNDSDSLLVNSKTVTRKKVTTPKPHVIKPTVLKKKAVASPVEEEVVEEVQEEVEKPKEITEQAPVSESPKEVKRDPRPREEKHRRPKSWKDAREATGDIRLPREPRAPKDATEATEKVRRERRKREIKEPRERKERSEKPKGDAPEQSETEKAAARVSLAERNKSFPSLDRPDFKKHLIEITKALDKPKSSTSRPDFKKHLMEITQALDKPRVRKPKSREDKDVRPPREFREGTERKKDSRKERNTSEKFSRAEKPPRDGKSPRDEKFTKGEKVSSEENGTRAPRPPRAEKAPREARVPREDTKENSPKDEKNLDTMTEGKPAREADSGHDRPKRGRGGVRGRGRGRGGLPRRLEREEGHKSKEEAV